MIGTILGHYRIVRALGRGGMGEVYAAEDTRLARLVALKVLPPAFAADADRLARFRREAQAVAALNHPNVVTIYSVEEAGGVQFLTMELVDGQTLAALIPPSGFALADLLRTAIPLVDAVWSAHAQGVVHRDLKPANVMVAGDGRVKVLDFGLAKRHEGPGGSAAATMTSDGLTAAHDVFGTPAYMSPEQGEGRAVDHRTDIFSLGIVLYQMATGRPPFAGDTPMGVLSSILKDTAAPLADARPDLPADLDRVVRRCLAKDPSRRYQTALDLRNELEELQQQVTAPVPVRPAPVHPRGRAMVATASIAAVAVVAAAAYAALTWNREAPLSASFTQLTSQPAAELFSSLSPDGRWIVYTGEGAGNRDIYLQSTSGQTPINLTAESPHEDEQPAFSPDGERIAFRSSRDGGGLFVMGRTGEAVRRVTADGFNPAWSPDGRRLAYTTHRMELRPQNSEGRSELWVVNVDGTEARRVYEGDATLPSWSPNGGRIAFAQRLGTDRQMNVLTIAAAGGEPAPIAQSETGIDWNPVWSPDGRYLYFVSDRGGSTNVWRVRIDEETGEERGPPAPITTPAAFAAHLSVSADGQRLSFSAVHETQNIQRLEFDPVTREAVRDPANLTTGSRKWSSPDPSPDGGWVAFYSQVLPEGDLYVIRADGTGLRQLTGDAAIDRVPRWSPDGAWISMFSDRNGRLQVWRIGLDGSGLQQVTDGDEHAVHAWKPDGTRVVSGRMASTGPGAGPAILFDPRRPWAGQTPRVLPPAPAPHREFVPNSWSADGRRIAGQNGYVVEGASVYSVDRGTYTRVSEVGAWPVWFPDSRHLLVVSRGREFHIIDTHARSSRLVYSVPRDTLGPPRLTRDGRAAYFSRRTTEADVWLIDLE